MCTSEVGIVVGRIITIGFFTKVLIKKKGRVTVMDPMVLCQLGLDRATLRIKGLPRKVVGKRWTFTAVERGAR